MEDLPSSSVLRWTNKQIIAEVVYTGRAREQLTRRLMQNDPKDGWRKGGNVFSPAIKGISPVLDVVQVLVCWHVDCCPLDPHCVVGAKPKSSRASESVIPVPVLAVCMSTATPPGYVSPRPCCPLPNNYREDDVIYVCVAVLLALHLGSGLFFEEI